jgi:hypothetical protein
MKNKAKVKGRSKSPRTYNQNNIRGSDWSIFGKPRINRPVIQTET